MVCDAGTMMGRKQRGTVVAVTRRGGVVDAGAVERAERAAATAAARASVEVSELESQGHLRAAADLFAEVWGTWPEFAPVSAELLRALTHTGNYVAGARDGSRLVGASIGFLAIGAEGYELHSHITGLLPAMQRRGIGYALKLHQRAWALSRRLPVVTWTFDPLVRRNGFFNLTKLGGEATGFYTNFYGAMVDRLNSGDESDRCEVTWDLASPRAEAASEGALAVPDLDRLLAGGAVILLADGDGEPRARQLAGDVRLCWVPPDIVALRAADPSAARSWRLALRETLGTSIEDGFVASGMTRSGWYVLERSG